MLKIILFDKKGNVVFDNNKLLDIAPLFIQRLLHAIEIKGKLSGKFMDKTWSASLINGGYEIEIHEV